MKWDVFSADMHLIGEIEAPASDPPHYVHAMADVTARNAFRIPAFRDIQVFPQGKSFQDLEAMGYKIDNRPLATIEPGWCDKCGETSWSRVMECQESSPGACRWIRGEPPCRYCGGTGHFYSDPELGPCGCSATAETGSISGPLAGFVTPEAPEPVPEAPRPPTVENPGFLIHPAPEDRSPISSQPAKRVEEDATHVLF